MIGGSTIRISKDPSACRGRLGGPIGLALCLLFGSACDRPEPETAVRIGVIAPLSGPLLESTGRPMSQAVQLAAARVNGAGGLRVGTSRHLVELLFEDSEDRPEAVVNAAAS